MSAYLLMSGHKDISLGPIPDQVLVFRTDLFTERDLEKIRPMLDQLLGKGRWNVDLADVDHILRVKTTSHQAQAISRLMQEAGYSCEELPD